MLASRFVWSAALLLAACGDDGNTKKDAAIDTPGDTGGGMCGAEAFFTGEYIDWDSTAANFCGVFGAKLTVRGDATRTSSTPPNGRFQLCVPHQAQTLVDIPPPTMASGCTGVTGMYPIRGIAVANDAVIAASGLFSARAMTQARVASMFTQVGQPLNANQAQLFVHVDGTPHQVALSTVNHSATQKFDGATWAAGDTGTDVFFPNVDVTGGAVQISVAGDATGTGTVPLEAGAFTYVTVIAH